MIWLIVRKEGGAEARCDWTESRLMRVMVTQAPPTIESCLPAGLPSARRSASVETLLLDLPAKPAGSLQLDVLCRRGVDGCGGARGSFRYPESTEQSVWRTINLRSDVLETRRIEVRFLVERPCRRRS